MYSAKSSNINNYTVDLNIDDDLWLNHTDFSIWQKKLDLILDEVVNRKISSNSNFYVNLLLTNDDVITDLNYRFRNQNKPTNVLSFQNYDKIDTVLNEKDVNLGDIAMSYQKIVQESNMFAFKFFDRCTHLFIHGVLHLLGMDHKNEFQEKEMESLEIKILEKFNIKNPYILLGE